MASTLAFNPTNVAAPSETIIIGRRSTLAADTLATKLALEDALIEGMLESIKDSGKATTFLPANSTSGKKLTIVALPNKEKITRNNHPFSPHSISDSLAGIKGENVQIHVIDPDIENNMGAAAVAIARAMPLYSSKSSFKKNKGNEKKVSVSFHNGDCESVESEELWNGARAVAEGVRLSARLGDMPPAELSPEAYSTECRRIAEELKANGADVTIEEIVGEQLQEKGYGGIYGVGMGARCPPRMVIMTYTPQGGEEEVENIALCGKGVVYDTGGLSLKPKTGMCGMKHDMGGSAGVLGGFQAAVQLKIPKKITLILGIVENAIGPDAVRNDDILTMYSGKTVEINNTDAEGRLVLADCVAHASKHIKGLDVILDMATLTGAQLVTTGKKHAGVLCKTAEMEKRIFDSGLNSGDLVYPMLYAPELLKGEFASKVADMKNSVKDRGNAQASCAGHFIEAHLDPSYKGDWVHVDMAGPDSKNERATGYGVALVLGLLNAPGFSK